jgi:4-alpha-glucanotransferase
MRLDDTARMNTPGKAAGNWSWRVGDSSIWRQLHAEQAALQEMISMYDRAPSGGTPARPPASGRSGGVTFG